MGSRRLNSVAHYAYDRDRLSGIFNATPSALENASGIRAIRRIHLRLVVLLALTRRTTDEQSDAPKSRIGRFLMVSFLAATG